MNVKHLDKQTTDGTVRNLDALYQLFPSCFTEAPDAMGEVHRLLAIVDTLRMGRAREREIAISELEKSFAQYEEDKH